MWEKSANKVKVFHTKQETVILNCALCKRTNVIQASRMYNEAVRDNTSCGQVSLHVKIMSLVETMECLA